MYCTLRYWVFLSVFEFTSVKSVQFVICLKESCWFTQLASSTQHTMLPWQQREWMVWSYQLSLVLWVYWQLQGRQFNLIKFVQSCVCVCVSVCVCEREYVCVHVQVGGLCMHVTHCTSCYSRKVYRQDKQNMSHFLSYTVSDQQSCPWKTVHSINIMQL